MHYCMNTHATNSNFPSKHLSLQLPAARLPRYATKGAHLSGMDTWLVDGSS